MDVEHSVQQPYVRNHVERERVGCVSYIITFASILLLIVTFPISIFFCVKLTKEYERAVVFRLGRLLAGRARGPGPFLVIPCTDSVRRVDLRTDSFDVPPQEVLTRDSVTVAVDAVVYTHVFNPTLAVTVITDANLSTRQLAAGILRNVVGSKNLSEILADRDSVCHAMQFALDVTTARWGVKVERVEVRDIRLPLQLQRAMAAEAEAAREARAKVISAEGEQKAARALKDAADVISRSKVALQLRYLQTLSTISTENNSTIIFPMPLDLLSAFMK